MSETAVLPRSRRRNRRDAEVPENDQPASPEVPENDQGSADVEQPSAGEPEGGEQNSEGAAQQPEGSEQNGEQPSAAATPKVRVKQVVSARLITLVADNLGALAEGLDPATVRAYLSNQLSYFAGVQQRTTAWDDRLGEITPLSVGGNK